MNRLTYKESNKQVKSKIPSLSDILRKVYSDKAEIIGEGSESKVIAIDDSIAAKIYYNLEVIGSPEKRAKNDFELGRYLKSHNVSVPEMYKLISPVGDIKNWILLMERINGTNLRNLRGQPNTEKVFKKRDRELKKLQTLCHNYDSDTDSNALYDPMTERVYLIDFTYCGKRESKPNFFQRMGFVN